MKKKYFISVIAAVAVCMAGCQRSVITGLDEQTSNEIQQTTPIIEVTEEDVTVTQTDFVTEPSAKTSEAETFEELNFEYPDEPFTAENLMKITTEAKIRLVQSGETETPWMPYRFGLLDIDFDGFPELFCEFCNANIKNHPCSLYSLKEENFCEKLLDYNAYYEFRDQGDSTYYVKRTGEKAIVVDTWWDADSHGVHFITSEINNRDGEFTFDEKFRGDWAFLCIGDNTYGYEPDRFYVDGNKVDLEEYAKEYVTYKYSSLKPAEYVYEGIDYICNIDRIYEITEKNYDELYSMYSSYIDSLIN